MSRIVRSDSVSTTDHSRSPVHRDAVGRTSPGLRILLVDDNESNQHVFRLILERGGHTVVIADNGREAVRRAPSGFDLILMDLQMPVMDGVEATRMIRQHEAESGAGVSLSGHLPQLSPSRTGTDAPKPEWTTTLASPYVPRSCAQCCGNSRAIVISSAMVVPSRCRLCQTTFHLRR